MIRLTITHVNKYGPLEFPAKQSQVFIGDNRVPNEHLKDFYQKAVDIWAQEHPDRQIQDWVKDIVNRDAMPDGSKYYGPTREALGGVIEEPI